MKLDEPQSADRRRSAHAAALRAARGFEAQRGEVRLRARSMRRVHRTGGRRAGVLLRHSGHVVADKQITRWRASAQRKPGADPTRLHRGAGGAMRLLHSRRHDARASAAAEKSHVSEADIRAYLEPHLCRCGTHMRILAPTIAPRRRCSRRMREAAGEFSDGHFAPCGAGRFRRVGAQLFVCGQAVGAKRCSVAGDPDAARGFRQPQTLAHLDAWIRVDASGAITVFTGKAELGQGIRTALMQIAAEQLDVDFGHIKLITADTALTPNEGYTAGSHSVQDAAPPSRMPPLRCGSSSMPKPRRAPAYRTRR